ncbi:MAG: hypothetical protein JRI71_16830 [Deltaproteobacteria bacterium]|nr:hypothetical protein [Deltaproteobacteria bacterium]MBW2079177.1 hypothetical protein [Deltaproteobacteria bacterium]
MERKERETGRNGDGGKQGEERSEGIGKRKARGTRQEEANSARQSDLIGQTRHSATLTAGKLES